MLRHVFFAYAAMGWALQESAETAARLGWALWGFWVLRDHQREGYRLAKALLASEVPPRTSALGSFSPLA